MSSHILSNEKFQTIANWLYSEGTTKTSCYSHSIKSFIGFEAGTESHHYASDESIKASVRTCLRNLYNLNRLAYVTRYGEAYDRNDDTQFIPKDNFVRTESVIKIMQSLRYQCAEYLACETQTYKDLEKFIGKTCENFFDNLNL